MMTDLLHRVVRKVNQQIFKNWSSERIVDVVGNDGAKYWIRFTGKDLKGEFAYKINPEEAVPQDQRTRREEITRFIELAANIPGLDMGYLIRSYAQQFDWLDPKMLFPGEGEGRSPEKAMQFHDFMRRGPTGQSSFPGLGR